MKSQEARPQIELLIELHVIPFDSVSNYPQFLIEFVMIPWRISYIFLQNSLWFCTENSLWDPYRSHYPSPWGASHFSTKRPIPTPPSPPKKAF